ncbi:hypothetical protein DFH09DRAFT_1309013 [Mycena vulgaris]|nr:hypothetical protein DFH09DRAFT_1309013 [Mycena vulgaris]
MSSSLMDSLLPPLPRNPPTTVTPVHPASVLAPHPPRTARRPAHTDKGRENEELRERIKTLEKSWDAVMKALAAQGMATGTLPAAPAAADPLAPAPASSSSPLPQPTADAPVSPPFSALEPTMTFPISSAPSHTSLDFDLDLSSSSSFMSSPVASIVGGSPPPSTALQWVVSSSTRALWYRQRHRASSEEGASDDATMEDLFRQILAPSSRRFQASPTGVAPSALFVPQVTGGDILGLEALVGSGVGEVERADDDSRIWTSEVEVDILEMDRILGLLPAADAAFQHNLNDLGLGLGWSDMESPTGGESALIGVF